MENLFDGEELLALAMLDLKKGEVAAGLAKLKQALMLSGYPAAVDVEAARVYAQLGLRGKARPHFQRYIEKAPNDVDARFQLGMLSFEDGDFATSISICDEVLKSASGYPPALFFKAAAVAALGNVPDARRLLRSAMENISTDNLYFSRSRDLLASLDAGAPDVGALAAAGQAYRTQH